MNFLNMRITVPGIEVFVRQVVIRAPGRAIRFYSSQLTAAVGYPLLSLVRGTVANFLKASDW